MADISKITLPNGASYDFKDSVARSGLAGKAAASHTHDDRYYTETEMNTKLSQKIDMYGTIHVSRNPTSTGYLKFADITTVNYGNKNIILLVSTEYNDGSVNIGNAIASINIRGEGPTHKSSIQRFSWLMKEKNFNTDLYYAVNDHTIEFYRSVNSGQYSQTNFKILNVSNFESATSWAFNLKSVTFIENTPLDTPIGTVVGMTNGGVVEYANNAYTLDGKHASEFAASSHTHSSYVNQNAFSNITVGSTTVSADSATDTLTLVAGNNITITPDANNDKITISSSHTHNEYASKALYGDTTINVGRLSGSTVGDYSTAEGTGTTASGNYSHAEGAGTGACGNNSHAEGCSTLANGDYSHAEGFNSQSNAVFSHVGGFGSYANGSCSFAHGEGVITNKNHETAFGKFNVSSSNTIFSIGDGFESARHNAFEITTTGGKLYDKDIAVKDDIPTISELIYTIRFSEITWNISGYGKYYYTINIPATTQLISANLGYWEGMYPDEFVQVTISDRTNIQLISNTAKETGLLAIRISYI